MKSITASTAANLAGGIVPAFVSLATVPLYISSIGQERYGILLLLWMLLGYFGLFDIGLGRAAAQRIAAFAPAADDVRAQVFWTALLLNTAFGLLGAIVLWPLAQFTLGHWVALPAGLRLEAVGVVPWLAAAVPLITVSGVLSGALQGREQFVALNLLHVVGVIVSQVAPLAVAIFWGPDIRLLVPVVLLARVMTCGVLLALCRRYVPLRGVPRVDRSLLKPLLGYGGWVTVTSIVGPLLTTLDRFVIGAVAGARAVTHYSVPFNLVSRMSILPGSLSSALFPRLAAESAGARGLLVERAVRELACLLTPLVLAAMLGMRPFLTWWVGDEFSGEASTVGQIIALGLWVNGLAYIPYTLLQARSRPDLVAKCHVAELPLYLGLLWIGLHFWGVVGAAVAWSVRVTMDACLLFGLSRVAPVRLGTLLPGGALLALAGLLVFLPALPDRWQWSLGVVVLLIGVWWAWRNSEFLRTKLTMPRMPARATP